MLVYIATEFYEKKLVSRQILYINTINTYSLKATVEHNYYLLIYCMLTVTGCIMPGVDRGTSSSRDIFQILLQSYLFHFCLFVCFVYLYDK